MDDSKSGIKPSVESSRGPEHRASSQAPTAPPATLPAIQAGKIICDRPRKAGPGGRRATHTAPLPNIWLLSAPGTAQPVPGSETGWGPWQPELVPPTWTGRLLPLKEEVLSSWNTPMKGSSLTHTQPYKHTKVQCTQTHKTLSILFDFSMNIFTLKTFIM